MPQEKFEIEKVKAILLCRGTDLGPFRKGSRLESIYGFKGVDFKPTLFLRNSAKKYVLPEANLQETDFAQANREPVSLISKHVLRAVAPFALSREILARADFHLAPALIRNLHFVTDVPGYAHDAICAVFIANLNSKSEPIKKPGDTETDTLSWIRTWMIATMADRFAPGCLKLLQTSLRRNPEAKTLEFLAYK